MRKVLKALLLTILSYLFQVCAMNQLKIPGQKICLWCVLRHRHSA